VEAALRDELLRFKISLEYDIGTQGSDNAQNKKISDFPVRVYIAVRTLHVSKLKL